MLKKWITGLLFIFTTLCLQAQPFRVFIVQDDLRKEVNFSDSVIELKKKPFVIEVHLLDSLDGIYVNISYDSLYYNTPKDTVFPDWEYMGLNIMAEDLFNSYKGLIVSQKFPCYWYYDEAYPLHRFDSIITKLNNGYLCTKTVTQTLNQNTREEIKAKDFNKPLILVFFSERDRTRIQPGIITKRVQTILVFK